MPLLIGLGGSQPYSRGEFQEKLSERFRGLSGILLQFPNILDLDPGMTRMKLHARRLFPLVLETECSGCPVIWVGKSWDLGAHVGPFKQKRTLGSSSEPQKLPVQQ